MLISVITVAWNAASTIEATCVSVDQQTHPDLEHLVIDGESTDGTLAAVARHPNPKRQVHSGPDAGLYDAMNKGLARARGEIIVFLNADDRYSGAQVLAEVHRAFVESGADAVYADIDMVVQDEPGRVQRRWRSGNHSSWKVLLGWHMPHPGLFIRRSMLERIGPFDTSFRIAADYDMMLRLMKQDGVRLHYLPMTAVHMAVGGLSTSGLKASWRGYLESGRALGRHAGLAGYLIAFAKPIWKLPQWLRGRAVRLQPEHQAPQRADSSTRSGHSARDITSSRLGLIHPLHVGKFVPPPFAGIESHVDTLLRSMSGIVDTSLVASDPSTPSTVRREPTPYRLHACRSYGTLASVAISPSLRQVVRREFAEHRANLLHVHAPNPWGDLAVLDASPSTPVVMTWHSDIVGRPALFSLYSAVQRKAVQRADRIIVFTPRHYAGSPQLQRYGVEAKIVTVSIGIDFQRLEGAPTDHAAEAAILDWSRGRPLVVTVGRQIPYKGYRYLIEAMARLQSEAVLLMIGTGPLRRQLQDQAKAIGVADRVRFMGEVAPGTLATALRLCDIFTLPSVERSEAFGIASAEAMAFGKPTVVCDLQNGVNHLNREGHTSLVTPPRDVGALAAALDELANNGPLRRAMGQEAARWVRAEFNVERMRSETLALYQSLG